MNYKEFLQGKRITVVGIGAINSLPDSAITHPVFSDILFLLSIGAQVTIIEHRAKSRVEAHINLLKQSVTELGFFLGDIFIGEEATPKALAEKYVEPDVYFISSEVVRDLPYLEAARKKGIPIETSSTLLLKCAPPVTLVGIFGVCGKTTVAHLSYQMLKPKFVGSDQKIFYLDPLKQQGYLSFLKKIHKGDVIIFTVGTDLIPYFHTSHVSPHVAVITNLDETAHDVLSVLKFQTYNNFLIASDAIVDRIKKDALASKAKILRTGVNLIPGSWELPIRELHMKENISLAMRVAELFKVDDITMQKVAESFKNLKSHIELVKKVRGVEYWNDAASTQLMSTKTALCELGGNKNTTLILGGMVSNRHSKSHGHELETFLKTMPQYVSNVILLPGTCTTRFHTKLLGFEDVTVHYAHSIPEAVSLAKDHTRSNDIVLFSPGFRSTTSWKEQGEDFVKAVRGL